MIKLSSLWSLKAIEPGRQLTLSLTSLLKLHLTGNIIIGDFTIYNRNSILLLILKMKKTGVLAKRLFLLIHLLLQKYIFICEFSKNYTSL